MMTFKTSMKTSYLVATDTEQAVDKYILLDVLVCMASKNTNNTASEMLYSRTVLRGFLIC